MSRDHFSLPEKSNAFMTPTPVITQTVRPSVTGDGDDMFCLRPDLLPPAIGFFHRTLCVLRSTAQSSSSPVKSAVATFRNTRSPQMMGVEPVRDGMGSFQAMFVSGVHVRGRPRSALTPLSPGPRHCGQLSAETAALAATESERAIRTADGRRIGDT